MRTLLVGVLAVLAAWPVAAQTPAVATDITAAEVQAFVKKLPRDRTADLPMRVVDTGGYRVGIFGVYRPKDSAISALVHQTKVTEVYYVLDGAGTLITGGTLRKPETAAASGLGAWTDVRSAGIDGGVSRRVSKGDIVIIPGGVPHMWSKLEPDVTYLIVRSDPEKQISLK